MWGCDYFQNFSWMGGVPGGIFSILLWGLIIFILVYMAIKLIGKLGDGKTNQTKDRYDSLGILKIRFAKGDISREEYSKMKSTLLET
ncbi:MAG: SHOCT domain-containing protein [Deltaproteobacteria bacterium]|nr:SHOCT domain-containing protein [Deltaproteobacteria bacterium]